MTRPPTGMIYDRALTRELLDLGMHVASQPQGSLPPTRALTEALKDRVSDQESIGKTKKCLSRIWVAPPPSAAAMIGWAVEHQELDPERIILHYGALLATFPFAGVVCSVIGRSLRLDGAVYPRRIREEIRILLGDRSSIDVGARKVTTTLRYLGLLQGPSAGPLLVAERRVPDGLVGWLAHAVLLTRTFTALRLAELTTAFELAPMRVENLQTGQYPLVESFTEGGTTVVVASGPKTRGRCS